MTLNVQTILPWLSVAVLLVSVSALQGADKQKVVGPFNGKDLTGWVLKRPQGSCWVAGIAKMDPDNPRHYRNIKIIVGD
jgi:hypothetical protein